MFRDDFRSFYLFPEIKWLADEGRASSNTEDKEWRCRRLWLESARRRGWRQKSLYPLTLEMAGTDKTREPMQQGAEEAEAGTAKEIRRGGRDRTQSEGTDRWNGGPVPASKSILEYVAYRQARAAANTP